MRLKKLLTATALFASLLLLPASQALAFNFFGGPACSATNSAGKTSPICQQAASQGTANPVVHILQIAVGILAVVAGMLAVMMILISGFQFITSAGGESAANARKRLVSSLVGLIIIALGWAIIRLITDQILS